MTTTVLKTDDSEPQDTRASTIISIIDTIEQRYDKTDTNENNETTKTEINKEEDHDENPEENREARRQDDVSSEYVSEEKSGESSEEDTIELDLETPILLQNTRRMISLPTPKPTDVVTRPRDKADEKLGTHICYFIHTSSCEVKYNHDITYCYHTFLNLALGFFTLFSKAILMLRSFQAEVVFLLSAMLINT